MFKQEYRESILGKVLSINKVLEGTETSSGEFAISGYKEINFTMSKTLSSDYVEFYTKITEDGDWQIMYLYEGGTEIKEMDTYTFEASGIKYVKFERVGTSEGDLRLDVSLTTLTN